jgi:hypothetical protein
MTRRKRWSIYGGVICVIAVAQFIFLSRIISPYPDVQRAPAEANRVIHPAGFSIVKPGSTRAIVEVASSDGEDSITILPDGGRSRYTPILSVRRLGQPPDLSQLERDGFKGGAFQGQQAIVNKGPSGKYDLCRIVVNRGGEWYEVTLLIPGGDSDPASIPSPEWQRYMDTFATATASTTSQASTRP